MVAKINPFTGKIDLVSSGTGAVTVSSSFPASGTDGEFLLNTATNGLYIWASDQWQLLHSLINDILLETGDHVLLETGDIALLE